MNNVQKTYKPGDILRIGINLSGNYPIWNEEKNYHELLVVHFVHKEDVLLCLKAIPIAEACSEEPLGSTHAGHSMLYLCLVGTVILGFYENEVRPYI